MKKIFVALSLLLSTLLLVFMVGCGSDDSGDANSPNDGTTVDTPSTDDTDGNEQQPALLEFEGISFASKTVMYNGKEQSITISGELPDGTTVVYSNNTATEVGVYEATATLTNPNYETKVLHATLTVNSIAASAVNVINTVLQRPDAWSFIPEAFGRENMAYSEADFPASDFTSGTNVSEISPRFVGAQLMVMYDGLLNMESILSKADVVFALGEAIAAAYQEFINDNPEEYTEFSTEIKGFKIFVSLEGGQSKLLAGNSTVSVELYADSDNNVNSGRISITDGASLKYEMNDTSLTFAYQIGVADAAKTSIISFARENDKVVGYIYEFLGYNGTGLTTTAVISLDNEYTRIVAKKRESDDLLILGYEEVYDSQTAEYISGKVSETVKLVDFETYWFNLSDISGINSIRVEDEANGMNADSIYVNGTSSLFVTEKIGGWGLDTLSRRYDIEMKTVYYYKAVTVEDEIEYEKVEVEIPMLFVQTKSFEDFSTDAYENNASAFSAKPQIKQGIADVADAEYEILMQTFDQIQLFEYTDVITYIGSPDSFFEDQQ